MGFKHSDRSVSPERGGRTCSISCWICAASYPRNPGRCVEGFVGGTENDGGEGGGVSGVGGDGVVVGGVVAVQ